MLNGLVTPAWFISGILPNIPKIVSIFACILTPLWVIFPLTRCILHGLGVQVRNITRRRLPIFEKYDIDTLVELFTPMYSEHTIRDLSRRGPDRMTPHFR